MCTATRCGNASPAAPCCWTPTWTTRTRAWSCGSRCGTTERPGRDPRPSGRNPGAARAGLPHNGRHADIRDTQPRPARRPPGENPYRGGRRHAPREQPLPLPPPGQRRPQLLARPGAGRPLGGRAGRARGDGRAGGRQRRPRVPVRPGHHRPGADRGRAGPAGGAAAQGGRGAPAGAVRHRAPGRAAGRAPGHGRRAARRRLRDRRHPGRLADRRGLRHAVRGRGRPGTRGHPVAHPLR
ncbi:hypothetical protein SGPA1_30256 [Streptomyces misionensis JCM 4497]